MALKGSERVPRPGGGLRVEHRMEVPHARRRRTVLITESSVYLLEIYTTLLRYHGYDTVEATDAAQTVELAREVLPDAIVLDMEPRGLSGLEATRLLRDDPATARTPVILLSMHSGTQYRMRAHQAGCRSYLEKPFEPRHLLDEVRRVLSPDPGLMEAALPV